MIRALLVAALLLSAGTASAQTAGDAAGRIFDEVTRAAIEGFYDEVKRAAGVADDSDATSAKDQKGGGKKQGGLPPGLARKEKLPPGLERQLQKNGTLPPGLARRDLPPDLAGRLPSTPPDIERIIVDTNVLLVEKATGAILDIIRDVVVPAGGAN